MSIWDLLLGTKPKKTKLFEGSPLQKQTEDADSWIQIGFNPDRAGQFYNKSTKDPKYLRDRTQFFRESGNGWWCDIIERRGRRPLAGKPRR